MSNGLVAQFDISRQVKRIVKPNKQQHLIRRAVSISIVVALCSPAMSACQVGIDNAEEFYVDMSNRIGITMVEELSQFLNQVLDSESTNDFEKRTIEAILTRVDFELTRGQFAGSFTDEQILRQFVVKFNLGHLGNSARETEAFQDYLSEWRSYESSLDGFGSLHEQALIVENALAELRDSIGDSRFTSQFHLSVFYRHGPICLSEQSSFQNAVGMDETQVRNAIAEFDFLEKYNRSQSLVNESFREFLSILNKTQMDSLSARLGISANNIHKIASLTDARDFVKCFNDGMSQKPVYKLDGLNSYQEVSRAITGLHKCMENSMHDEGLSNDYELLLSLNQCSKVIVNGAEDAGLLGSQLNDLAGLLNRNRALFKSNDTISSEFTLLESQVKQLMESSRSCEMKEGVSARFHCVSIEDVSIEPPLILTKIFATRAANPKIPSVNQLWLSGSVVAPSVEYGMAITWDQQKELQQYEENWQEEVSSASSFEKVIEINNGYMEGLNDILFADQLTFPFRYFFCSFGPYHFFQRSDVQQDFGITRSQLVRMERHRRQVQGHLEKLCHENAVNVVLEFFDSFSEEERVSVQNHLGYSLEDLADSFLLQHKRRELCKMFDDSTTTHSPRRTGVPGPSYLLKRDID